MPTQLPPAIGVPYGLHIPGTNALTACPECKAVFPSPQTYALHYEQDHFTPLGKVLAAFQSSAALAFELSDQVEKSSPIQCEALKASGETLVAAAKALRSAMEESGLG